MGQVIADAIVCAGTVHGASPGKMKAGTSRMVGAATTRVASKKMRAAFILGMSGNGRRA